MEGDRIGIGLRAAAVEHRRQVGAAAEPPTRGDDHAGVHVDSRHVGVPRMRDQRDAGRPEARVFLGAGDLLAEFGREFAEHGRGVDADLLEDAAVHDRHGPAATFAFITLPGVRSKRPGGHDDCWPPTSSSMVSKPAQIVSRSASNQARARLFLSRCRRAGRPVSLGVPCWRCSPGARGKIGTRIFRGDP